MYKGPGRLQIKQICGSTFDDVFPGLVPSFRKWRLVQATLAWCGRFASSDSCVFSSAGRLRLELAMVVFAHVSKSPIAMKMVATSFVYFLQF